MAAQILQFVPRSIPAKAHLVMHSRQYGDLIAEMATQIISEYDDVHVHLKPMNIENCHMREVLIDKLATKYNSTVERVFEDIQQYIVENYDMLHATPTRNVLQLAHI